MAKPEIRLKGFEGEWEKLELNHIFQERHVISTITQDLPQLSFTIEEGVIKPEDRKSNKRDFLIKDKTNKKYLVTLLDDMIYNPANVIHGAIHKNSLCNGVVSPIYKIFHTNQNADFLDCIVRRKGFIKEVSKYMEGTVLKLRTLKPDSFLKLSIHIGTRPEQNAIADYFKSLDSMLQSTTKKIESLKQMKSACLVSMFPQAGETTPRVRFKGFEGEWEDVSFRDISYPAGTKNRENLPLESYSISNEFGFIPQQEQFENGGTMSKADKKMYYVVTPDSFAYNPARINVGSIGYDNLDKDVIVSSLYVVFKTDDKTYNPFLDYWFKTPMFKKMIELYQEGGVRLYFFYDKLCSCHFRRPSLKEQQRIASYFKSLDKQISLQEQRLEKLKQIKAACLDKMFV